LTRPEFYEGYFDEIHLFSPTGASDDIFANLNLSDEFIHMDMSVEDLQDIMEAQREEIEEKKGKLHKCKKILIIFEDVQANGAGCVAKRSTARREHAGSKPIIYLCSEAREVKWKFSPMSFAHQA
jgi:hypothetical protein